MATILTDLLKDFTALRTVTSIAKSQNLSRVGAWKNLKRMQKDRLIQITKLSSGKTSTGIITLDWQNPLTEKTLALELTEESTRNQRWRHAFQELEHQSSFLIIFGSILTNPKEAGDIDLLSVSNRKNLNQIAETINKIQKSQSKKIHLTNLTEQELRQEINANNRPLIDAIRKGIVLFGQENFIKTIRSAKQR